MRRSLRQLSDVLRIVTSNRSKPVLQFLSAAKRPVLCAGFALVALTACRSTESGIYERVFYGPAIDLANIECVLASSDLERMFVAADWATSFSNDGSVEKKRACMLDSGWKEVPATNTRAQRAQVYTLNDSPA